MRTAILLSLINLSAALYSAYAAEWFYALAAGFLAFMCAFGALLFWADRPIEDIEDLY